MPRHEPRHGRFAGAGVAEEHHMQAHGAVRQAVFLAQLAHFDEIREIFDLALDRAETDKLLELCHQLLKARLRGLFCLLRGRFGVRFSFVFYFFISLKKAVPAAIAAAARPSRFAAFSTCLTDEGVWVKKNSVSGFAGL